MVENSNFEESEPCEKPSGWSVFEYNPQNGLPGKNVVDKTESINGEKSLQFNVEPIDSPGTDGFYWDVNVRQEISGAKFEINQRYYPVAQK